ncbi:MAG: apolipoprotein N-acyltransferase [Gammaproteobacteria bacterium]|jgi:apolipoprotein N-acyltransferase
MPRHYLDKIPKWLLCLLAGAALPLAFSPYDLPALAVLAPAVLIAAWLNASPGRAFGYGYVFGLGMFGIGVNWLHISINLFGGMNFIGSLAVTWLLVAFLALYPALTGYLSRRLFARLPPAAYLLVAVPALWVLVEWLRGWLFTGFPWLDLGYSQIDTAAGGLAPLAGVYAVSAATVLAASALVALFRLPLRDKVVAVLLAAAVWSGAWLAGRQHWTQDEGRRISVALVQGDVPQDIKWDPALRRDSMRIYRDLTEPHLNADLIVWPETSIPALYRDVKGYLEQISQTARRHGTAVLTGIPYQDPASGRYYNSLVVLDGRPPHFYHKKHLVPFGEYIPFADTLGGILEFLHIPMSDFSPGPDVRPLLTANGIRIGVSICYEDTFGEEVIQALPAAEILVNVSNDAWFGDSAAPHQHLQMARMRSLETGRYMLRATNTGVTALINEKGKVLKATPEFQRTVLAGRAELFHGETPYAAAGNYPIVTLGFVLLGVGAILQRKKK